MKQVEVLLNPRIMDLMYMISRKYTGKVQFYNDFMDIDDELRGLIRISANNIVAWVTKYELNDSTDQSLGSRVYVADLNMPWNFHRVSRNDNTITLLEWDLYGECLMIGDDSGSLSIWSYREYIFNDWTCVGQVNLLGEYMIAGAFYHSGRKLVLNIEKRDSPHYYEKFNYARYKPTVQVCSGTALDGCVAVTSTGLIVACIMLGDTSAPMLTTTESISSIRYKISVVDIAYAANGNLIVATSCGSVRMPIKCYEISITYTNKKTCSINSHPLAGFFLDISKLKGNSQDWYISHIRFLVKDITNSLVVVVNSQNGSSLVQLWEFSTDDSAGHMSHVFNEAVLSNDVFKTLNWKCNANYEADSAVEAVSTPKMLMYNNSNASCYVILVYKNNRVKALSRALKEELQYNLNNFWDTKDIKRVFSNISIADIDISWLANIVVISDNAGNFYVIQIQNSELNGPLTVNHSATMLEYCLVSGLDFWDVAMSLKPSILETISERFSENFNKQLATVQQQEYGGFLSMKAFLHRLSSNSAQKHSDLLSLLTLYSISVAFKSFLRPLDVNSYSEKGPGENLIPVLLQIESSNLEITGPLTIIDPKEFAVDPTVPLSFQQLIQWVAHLALNILGRVPDHHKTSGYDIVNDNHALNILREVLVMSHLWGYMKPLCLPVFMKNGNFNGMVTLYRHITRLIQCNQNNEIDENFVDECYLLRNQVFFPTITLTALEINDIASPAFHREPLPMQFIFGCEPDSILYEIDAFTLDGSSHTIQNTDIIKHIYLGESIPHKMKQCNRCQGKTQMINSTKSWAIRSWEDRWMRSCICGGRWRYIKTSRSPYSIKKI